jgi:hypothetical protein
VKGALEVPVKVTAAVTAGATGAGAFLSVIAVKSIIASWNDCSSATDELIGAMEEERSQYQRLKGAVNELKKLKKPAPVPQSKIDTVSNMLGPYGARLLGVDAAAKKTAAKLDRLLNDLEKGKFRHASTQEEMEKKVDAMIKQIIERSKNVTEGRRLLQAAKDKVVDAGKRAQKDPTSFWDYAPSVWKVVDAMLDCGEAVMEKFAWDTVFDTLLGKLNDELKDAEVEARTKI